MRRLLPYILAALAARSAHASVYVQQSTFTLPLASINAMDSDAVGNLYVLGLPAGATTYAVASYATHGITPLFSFDTGVSSPAAFAVEPSGIVDIVDTSGGYGSVKLKRFQNNGVFIGQAAYSVGSPYYPISVFSAAIDKANQRVYLAYQQWVTYYCLMCLGCPCPPSGTKGFIGQYDFSGTPLKSITMPGISATAGSCYTPSSMTVDPQSNFYVADASCQHLLKYSSAGSLLSDTAASKWTYTFSPRGMWTDAASDLYISEAVCGPTGCPQGVVKLGSDGSIETSVVADSPMGCAWDQRILYLSSSGGQPLRRMVFNGAPSVAPQSAPLGTVVQHSSAASMNWQSSNDPDGDQVTYSVYLGTSASQLPFAGTSGEAAFTSQALAFGATYYWQLISADSYLGLPLQATPSPIVSFNLNPVNNPPNAFGVVRGTGTVVTRDTLVTLSWQAATDPDGDPVVYDVLWRPASQAAASLAATTGQASYQMAGLSFGTTYYWSVRARDVYNVSRMMGGGAEQPYYPMFKNSPPPAPPIAGGIGTSGQHTFSPSAALSWLGVADPDGDPVAYRLYVGTAPAALAPVSDSSLTSYSLPSPSLGTTYYWQVGAYDPYGGASTSAVQGLYIFLQNSPPSAFGALSGAGSFSTRNTSQLLSWQSAFDPDGDPVSYDLALSTDPAVMPVVQTSTATSYALGFQFGTTYYWQVTARDGFGGATSSGLQTFVPVFRNSPPTAPVNQSRTGTILYHGFSPSQSFFWQASTDPDGDPFFYSLYLGTDAAKMSAVAPAPLGYTLANLAVNTAYYFKIVATDIFGASSDSPVNWVYYQFTNSPPQPFDVIGTTGTLATRDTTAALSWTLANDADGDVVTYRVFTGTAPAALSPFADTTQPTAALDGLGFGTTYYWRVEAYDGFGGSATINGGTQSIYRVFRNSPPAPLVYLTTAAAVGIHTTEPVVNLNWAASADPDGDPVSYRLEAQSSTGAWVSADLGASRSYPLPVVFASTYTWRVTASDPYGGAFTGPWLAFAPYFSNQPPGMPSIVSGSGASSQHALSPSATLAWSPAPDPEGDPVSYSLYLGTSPVAMALIQQGSSTSYALSGVRFGTAYYWQVAAVDSFGAVSPAPVQSLLLSLKNSTPTPFAVLTGSATISTRATSQVLSWQASIDPDGDAVSYGLLLSTASDSPALVQLSTATSFLLNFQFGTTYYWRVDAYDGFGGTTTAAGGIQAFLPLFLNDPPAPINLVAPFKGSPVVTTMQGSVAVSWSQVTTPQGDPITYTVYLGDSADAQNVLVRIAQTQSAAGLRLTSTPAAVRPLSEVQLDGDSVKLRLTGLDYYKTYYFRVVASNPYGASSQTPLQTFSLGAANGFPKAYNYPNPFNPSRGATHLVFNAPPSGYSRATVSVYSEFQDLLFRREYPNIPPGVSQVDFDGRDRYGRALFNGSYICHVRFEGPDDKETFYMMVVK